MDLVNAHDLLDVNFDIDDTTRVHEIYAIR